MAEQTLNIPQIVAVVLVGILALRWFFASSSPQNGNAGGGTRPVDPAHIEQVHQMFPQLDRRTIAWDLQRNGGNVSATTEVVLAGRTLPQPPPSFQPQGITPTTSRTAASGPQANKKAPIPDLITRYNLSTKVSTPTTGGTEASGSDAQSKGKSGWSQNKNERSEILKRRREEMVLAARRKMEARDRDAGPAT